MLQAQLFNLLWANKIIFYGGTKFIFKAAYFLKNFPDKNVVTQQQWDKNKIVLEKCPMLQIVSLFKLTSMATSVSNNVESFALFG